MKLKHIALAPWIASALAVLTPRAVYGDVPGGVDLYAIDTVFNSRAWADCDFFPPDGCDASTHLEGQHKIADQASGFELASVGYTRHDDYDDTISGVGAGGRCYRALHSVKLYQNVFWVIHTGDFMSGSQCAPAPPPPDDGSPGGGGTIQGYCDTPVMVDLDGGGVRVAGLEDPVLFDLDGDGTAEWITWPERGSSTVLLAMDRNGNGLIDSGLELFGNKTLLATGEPPPEYSNGYVALAEYDLPGLGGNGNGVLDPGDSVWSRLLLWHDVDHNGLSAGGELSGLSQAGVTRLDRDYKLSYKRDRAGNLFRFKGRAWATNQSGNERVIQTYDVLLQRAQ